MIGESPHCSSRLPDFEVLGAAQGLGGRLLGGGLLLLRRHGRLEDFGIRQVARVAAPVVLRAVAKAAQALVELPGGDVDGGVAVGRFRLGADDRALAVDGELDALGCVGLPGVALVGQFDVDALGAGVELSDLGYLFLHVLPEVRMDLGITCDDGDVHVFLHGDERAALPARAARTWSPGPW